MQSNNYLRCYSGIVMVDEMSMNYYLSFPIDKIVEKHMFCIEKKKKMN